MGKCFICCIPNLSATIVSQNWGTSCFRERRKKIIQDNIDLLKVESNIKKLRKDIDKFQTELDAMNADAVRNKYNTALNNSRQYTNKIERFNGRLQGLAEQKRNLKKKLNEPEYKGVDERQRMKMIEHETTNIVVTDLDKYYDALDKALLSYHGMKINDINKIIRELWSLTYKGGGTSDHQQQICFTSLLLHH
jgi:DNA repair protein RAD50